MPDRREQQPYIPEEHRPQDTLRPLVEIALMRDLVTEEVEIRNERRISNGATDEWHDNLNNHFVDSLQIHPTDAQNVVTMIQANIAIIKGYAWGRGLEWAQKEGFSLYLYETHGDVTRRAYEPNSRARRIDTPKHARSSIVIDDAQIGVDAFIEDSFEQSEQAIIEFTSNSRQTPRERELERMHDAIQSTDDYIDYQLARGELGQKLPPRMPDRLLFTATGYFLKSTRHIKSMDAYDDLSGKLNALSWYEEHNGYKEALDYALGKEDENNGLARLVTKHKQTPPRT